MPCQPSLVVSSTFRVVTIELVGADPRIGTREVRFETMEAGVQLTGFELEDLRGIALQVEHQSTLVSAGRW